jgi:dephospho-CoA kinase
MFLLGLTGNIACGKSTVARMLAARGAAHLDADLLVRALYAEPVFARRVAALFPEHSARLLTPQQTVDRRALAELVFSDDAALKRLEMLVHPAVAARRAEKLRALAERQPPPRVVVVEAVKLIESGQAALCDAVWCVVCPPSAQLQRLTQERGFSEAEARRRLEQQPVLEQQRRLMESTPGRSTPFVVIANDGSLDALGKTVNEQWKALNFENQRP